MRTPGEVVYTLRVAVIDMSCEICSHTLHIMPCMLDSLPWDILHTIFDHLDALNLLHAFVDVNAHLNTIIHSYSRIQLNFKSIKKSIFYYICERIQPEQVQSLILSNDKDTPGQIKLFMSLLPLIKFHNLQYLTIHQVDDANLFSLMLSHMENNPNLYSLSVTGSPIAISKKTGRSITEVLSSLPCLTYLTFMESSPLITLRQPLSQLTHLTINSCALNDLPIIFRWIPNLIYLHVSIPFDIHLPTFDEVPPRLSTLIYISRGWALFHQIENFLSRMPSLRRLVLETSGDEVLLDGKRWEQLIKEKLPRLKELALAITPEENNLSADHVLASFHSHFWTNEKNWRMACLISTVTQSCVKLFSMPYFASTDEWYPLGEGFTYHSLTPSSFYESCKELKIAHFLDPPIVSSPLERVETLSFHFPTAEINQLQKVVNLLSVKHLVFTTIVRSLAFNDLLQAASNINRITMSSKLLERLVNSFSNENDMYEQIKKLTVNDVVSVTDIATLSRLFPKVEHLSLLVKQHDDVPSIFNRFHHLISATVSWSYPLKVSVDQIEEYLHENTICSDGSYHFHLSSLNVWID